MDVESDEDEYVFYGTPLQDEPEGDGRVVIGQHTTKDPSQLRSLPVHKQEAVDEQGRRRFHGAFTGGFSAGYFNTVGSKEGFQPAEFKSSRSQRVELKQQSLDDFLDEDEREERAKSSVQVTGAYDTFGSRAADAARSAAQAAADARPSLIPGPVLEELVVPVASSIGVQLLQKMGWRQGKGIGSALAAADASGGSKWGAVAGIGVQNTPLYVLHPKEDVHGLGYDAFRGADEFRQHKQRKLQQQQEQLQQGRRGNAAAAGAKRQRGVAFGTGVIDDDDTMGYTEELEDYVLDADEGPGRRPPKGARREALALAYEEASEESDDDDRFNPRTRGPARITDGGRGPTLLLTSRQEQTKHGSFIPGFAPASGGLVEFPEYPAIWVPDGWVAHHTFQAPAGSARSLAGKTGSNAQPEAAPPEAPPPADPELRREMDALAAQVARSGPALEELALQQAGAPGGHYRFLLTGESLGYYRWRLHRIRAALAAAGATQTTQSTKAAPAAGPKPSRRGLSIEERAELLGEQPLPASAPAAPVPRTVVSHVADADRQHLASVLGSNFVRGEAQDMSAAAQKAQEAVAGLWRPPPRPAQQQQPLAQAAGGLPPAAAAFLAGVASRFEGGSSAATAVLQPDAAGMSHQGLAAAAAGTAGVVGARGMPGHDLQAPVVAHRPMRTFVDWRPAPLLCKRFNVPDPYKGRAAPAEALRSRTDTLSLPETAALAKSAAALAALGVPLEFAAAQPLPAAPPAAGAAAVSAYPPPPPLQQDVDAGMQAGDGDATDAAAMAAELLGELSREFAAEDAAAQGGAALLPPPASSAAAAGVNGAEPVPDVAEIVVEDKPLDLFKAIFEAESEEEEQEEAEGEPQEQQREQPQQQANGASATPVGTGSMPRPPSDAADAAGTSAATVTAAKGLADAFLRARERATSGAEAGPSGTPAAARQQQQQQQTLTPEEQRRQEILEALRSLKKSSKSSKHKKKHKHSKDERRSDRKKRRKSEKDRGSKSKHAKHKEGSSKRRSRGRDSPVRSSDSGGSSSDNSSGSSL